MSGGHLTVTKRNDLIEARYDLSAVSLNLFNAILARIDPTSDDLPSFKFDRTSLALFMKQSGFDPGSVYKYSARIVKELLGLTVFLERQVDPDRVSLKGTNVFENTEVVINKKTNQIEEATFTFTKAIQPTIQDLTRNYTRFQLAIIGRLESKYAKRIYELLLKEHAITRRYKTKGNGIETKIRYEIRAFRAWLGIADSSYKQFPNFRRKVLDIAQKQLKTKADICFDYKPMRVQGNGFTHIEFTVYNNVLDGQQDDFLMDSLVEGQVTIDPQIAQLLRMAVVGITEEEITVYFQTYDPVVLREAAGVSIRAVMSGKVKSPSAFFAGVARKAAFEWEGIKNSPGKEQHKTTLEKLLDRSWCEGMFDDLGDED